MRTGKALGDLFDSGQDDDPYGPKAAPCRNRPCCDGSVGPILVTPTFVKDYDNAHISRVWEEAEEAMKEADRAFIIGYSLPTDDVEVAMLLKRGLAHLCPKKITVVEYEQGEENMRTGERTRLGDHPVGQRYRSLFGPDLDWHTTGFEGWLKEQRSGKRFPFAAD